jgi:hypothetical protein
MHEKMAKKIYLAISIVFFNVFILFLLINSTFELGYKARFDESCGLLHGGFNYFQH